MTNHKLIKIKKLIFACLKSHVQMKNIETKQKTIISNLVAINEWVFRFLSHFQLRTKVTDKTPVANLEQKVNHPKNVSSLLFCCQSEKKFGKEKKKK